MADKQQMDKPSNAAPEDATGNAKWADQIKSYSETIKNVVITFSVIVAGLWTYSTYLAPAPAADAKLHCVLRDHPQRDKRYIAITATLRNAGNVPLDLSFHRPLLIGADDIPAGGITLAEITEQTNGVMEEARQIPVTIRPRTAVDGILLNRHEDLRALSLDPGCQKGLPFIASVGASRVYRVDFCAYHEYRGRQTRVIAQQIVIVGTNGCGIGHETQEQADEPDKAAGSRRNM